MKQARQAVSAFKKSILLRCLWWDAMTPHEKVASMSADINACLDSALVKIYEFSVKIGNAVNTLLSKLAITTKMK
jgi:hypothetical protein